MSKQTQDQIDFVKSRMPFIQAFADGKEVQWYHPEHELPQYRKLRDPMTLMNHTAKLRLAPEPVKVLFGPTDVWGKLFRKIGYVTWQIHQGIKPEGVFLNAGYTRWQTLADEYEHSTDGGLTWKPCWKEGAA